MKCPIERIKNENDWTIQDMAIMADVSGTAAYRTIKGESREINAKILKALQEAGYDPEELKAEYREYRKMRRRELIESE